MKPRPDSWGLIRSVLHETFSFGSIKAIVGQGGIAAHRHRIGYTVSASEMPFS